MRMTDGQVRFGAGDLVNHLACRYLTELNLHMAEGVLAAPGDRDPMLDLLRQRGLAHEGGYIQHLEESCCQITRIDGVGLIQTAVDATVEAMRSDREVMGFPGDDVGLRVLESSHAIRSLSLYHLGLGPPVARVRPNHEESFPSVDGPALDWPCRT